MKKRLLVPFLACLAFSMTASAQTSVDPKTVTAAKPTDAGPATMPKPAAAPTPGVYTYAGRVELGEQSMDLPMSTEIKDDPAGWAITDTIKSQQGDAVDKGTFDKGTLALRKRVVTQGPITIALDVAPGGKVSGSMGAAGESKPIAFDAGGDLFADGPGAAFQIAALPLAVGYKTAFRNMDLQKMTVKVMNLTVAGSEQVTVPAGTFDAWKVNLTSDDGSATTVWVDKASRKPVKMSATMPQMNGAQLTAELLK